MNLFFYDMGHITCTSGRLRLGAGEGKKGDGKDDRQKRKRMD